MTLWDKNACWNSFVNLSDRLSHSWFHRMKHIASDYWFKISLVVKRCVLQWNKSSGLGVTVNKATWLWEFCATLISICICLPECVCVCFFLEVLSGCRVEQQHIVSVKSPAAMSQHLLCVCKRLWQVNAGTDWSSKHLVNSSTAKGADDGSCHFIQAGLSAADGGNDIETGREGRRVKKQEWSLGSLECISWLTVFEGGLLSKTSRKHDLEIKVLMYDWEGKGQGKWGSRGCKWVPSRQTTRYFFFSISVITPLLLLLSGGRSDRREWQRLNSGQITDLRGKRLFEFVSSKLLFFFAVRLNRAKLSSFISIIPQSAGFLG